jgi:hypothetical protein
LPKAKEYYSLSVKATSDEVKNQTPDAWIPAQDETLVSGTLMDTGSAWTVTGLL